MVCMALPAAPAMRTGFLARWRGRASVSGPVCCYRCHHDTRRSLYISDSIDQKRGIARLYTYTTLYIIPQLLTGRCIYTSAPGV